MQVIYKTSLIFLFILFWAGLNAQSTGAFHFIANTENPKESILFYSLMEEEPNWQKDAHFKVYVKDKMKGPSVYGTYTIEENQLIFQPFYGWSPGQSYQVVWIGKEAFIKDFNFKVPEKITSIPQLNAIYPGTDSLPANQLKLYLQFSKPMALGYVYEMVELYDKNGKLLEKPFLELQPELWDSSGKQICLWFDPGRLKRDLNPNLDLGTPLEQGKSYTLIVKQEWQDRDGRPLKESFEKEFVVGPSDRQKPVVKHWELMPPTSQEEALCINFNEVMDATALSKIEVINANGEIVLGNSELEWKEKSWIFYPIKNWEKGFYKIRVDAKLEDLAGNNLNRLFDRDLWDENQKLGEETFYWLIFEIR